MTTRHAIEVIVRMQVDRGANSSFTWVWDDRDGSEHSGYAVPAQRHFPCLTLDLLYAAVFEIWSEMRDNACMAFGMR